MNRKYNFSENINNEFDNLYDKPVFKTIELVDGDKLSPKIKDDILSLISGYGAKFILNPNTNSIEIQHNITPGDGISLEENTNKTITIKFDKNYADLSFSSIKIDNELLTVNASLYNDILNVLSGNNIKIVNDNNKIKINTLGTTKYINLYSSNMRLCTDPNLLNTGSIDTTAYNIILTGNVYYNNNIYKNRFINGIQYLSSNNTNKIKIIYKYNDTVLKETIYELQSGENEIYDEFDLENLPNEGTIKFELYGLMTEHPSTNNLFIDKYDLYLDPKNIFSNELINSVYINSLTNLTNKYVLLDSFNIYVPDSNYNSRLYFYFIPNLYNISNPDNKNNLEAKYKLTIRNSASVDIYYLTYDTNNILNNDILKLNVPLINNIDSKINIKLEAMSNNNNNMVGIKYVYIFN